MPTQRKAAPARSAAAPTTAALADFETFAALSAPEKKAVAKAVATELGDDFRAGSALVGEAKLASVVHVPSDIELVLVPGGAFEMGFSDADQAAVDACFEDAEKYAGVRKAIARTAAIMRPVHTVQLRPFALARTPIDDPSVLTKLLGAPQGPDIPRAVASALLARWGFRFPSEAECEYVAREGRGLSFLLDVVATYREGVKERVQTAWGVGQLGQAVWVGDRWHRNYVDAPSDGSAWTTGKGRGMYRGSFSLGLSEMQTDQELVFALASLRVEPRAKEDDTEVWLRLALGPDETGRWRCQAKAPLAKPTATSKKPKPVTRAKKPEGSPSASLTPSMNAARARLDAALAQPSAAKAGKLAGEVLLALGLPAKKTWLVPLREDLSDELFAALGRIMEERPDLPLYDVAVPEHPDTRRRWLGLLPGGVLEQLVAVEAGKNAKRAPLWRVIAERDRAAKNGKEAPVRDLASPAESTRAFLEIALTSGYLNTGRDPSWKDILAAGPEQAAWALDWLSRWEREIARGGVVVLTDSQAFGVLYPVAAAGKPVRRAWTKLLPIDGPKQASIIWSAVAESERDSALADALGRTLPRTQLFQHAIAFVRRFPRPAAAQACRDYFTSSDAKKKHGVKTMARWLGELATLCESIPALRTAPAMAKKARR